MGKERGSFRRHKLFSGVLVAGMIDFARKWTLDMRSSNFQGPDNRWYPKNSQAAPQDPMTLEHERSRNVSRETSQKDRVPYAQLRGQVHDRRLTRRLAGSSSLFPGGVQKFLDETDYVVNDSNLSSTDGN